MSARRPVYFFLIVALAFLVLFEAITIPEEETWSVTLERESRRVQDKRVIDLPEGLTAREQKDAMRKAARAQWDLAEWHFARGDYAKAEEEYRRYKSEFPYVELDYGYRTDDATNRLNQIKRIRQKEKEKLEAYPGP